VDDYQSPLRFPGTIDKLTVKLVPPVRTAAEEDLLKRETQEAINAAQ